MLREAISELHRAGNVEIVRKVRYPHICDIVFNWYMQLIKSLDVPTFKEVGITINDIVSSHLITRWNFDYHTLLKYSD